MTSRVSGPSRKVQRRQLHRIVLLLAFVGSLGCSGLTAEAKSNYNIINTGITGAGCWVDDSHFIVEKRVSRQGSQGSDLEGLYVLDPLHPTELKPISLAPLELSAQKRVWQVACRDGNITFLVPGSKKGSSRLYRLTIGEAPELIVEMRAPRVNLQGKYVLGNSHRAVMDGGPLQGAFEGNDDCLLADAKAGFKVLCWDWWLVVPEALPQFVFSQYLWQESIKIKDSHGQAKQVLNPEPPLKLSDGSELKMGYLLRDLENQIVMQVKMEQPPYQIYRNTMISNPQGDALYAACSKAGDHGTRRLTVGGRICRFAVDGVNREWREVVAVQQDSRDPLSLQYFDVNRIGDVVALEPAHGDSTMFWKYSATTRRVEKVRHVPFRADLGLPKLSPSGEWISFIENHTIHLAHDKGVRP